MTKRFAAVAVALLCTTGAVQARTTTVDFAMLDGTTTIANGSFSFDAGKTGLLTYSDLDSFNFTLPGGSYDLAFTQSGGFTEYYYFGYNATTQAFQSASLGGYTQILSAIKNNLSGGYFARNDSVNVVRNYNPESGDRFYTTLTLSSSTSGVPEPTTWALMIAGFGVVGCAMRRRSATASTVKVSYAA